jgi:hypothetical protein
MTILIIPFTPTIKGKGISEEQYIAKDRIILIIELANNKVIHGK